MNEKPKVLTTLATGLSAASIAQSLLTQATKKYEDKFLYSASLKGTSYIYDDLLEWLNLSSSGKTFGFRAYASGVSRIFTADRPAKVNIGGYRVKVEIEQPDVAKVYDADGHSTGEMDTIYFSCRDPRGIDAVGDLLEELIEKKRKRTRTTHLYTTHSHGWRGDVFKGRSIDSVFLPEGVKESLMADLESFFENEEHYDRIGAPWHRGYLLYGPPGNGKSSLASAIAKHYRFNLYSMPLSAVKDDRDLMDRINTMNSHSVLLLEDIDIFSKAMKRTQESSGPTLAGLLNALDGVGTPHGLVTVMTTNNIDALDEALIRRGRVDLHLELTKPNYYQIAAMFNYAYGEALGVEPAEFKSMADLSDVFKRHVADPEAARVEIKNGHS